MTSRRSKPFASIVVRSTRAPIVMIAPVIGSTMTVRSVSTCSTDAWVWYGYSVMTMTLHKGLEKRAHASACDRGEADMHDINRTQEKDRSEVHTKQEGLAGG